MLGLSKASPRNGLSSMLAMMASLSISGPTDANAQSVAGFYSGKDLKFIIPDGAGGGYDAYSRLLARHLGKHIPGKPHIMSENMPGAERAGRYELAVQGCPARRNRYGIDLQHALDGAAPG